MTTDATCAVTQMVTLSDGALLALRHRAGELRPFLLVHGLASNALMWEGVAEQLAGAGHEVVSVDLRGHGLSSRPATDHSTEAAAEDLSELLTALGWVGSRRPIVVGQSWGGNVVLHLAAHGPDLHAVCAVDGGWIQLGRRFDTFDECWTQLAPPDLGEATWTEVTERLSTTLAGWPPGSLSAVLANLEVDGGGVVRNRLSRAAHRQILYSLWHDNPSTWYPLISLPVLFLVAGDEEGPNAAMVLKAAAATHARIRWYPDAHHDLHVQHPGLVTHDLLQLARPAIDTGDAS